MTEIDLTWLDARGEPLQGSSYRFEPGRAPATWKVDIALPEGAYGLESTVQRGAQKHTARQDVFVKGDDPIVVSLP